MVDCEYKFLSVAVAVPSTVDRTQKENSSFSSTKENNLVSKKTLLDTASKISIFDEKRKQNVVLRHDLVMQLIKNCGFTIIEANEKLRYLEDNNELLPLNEFFITYSLEKPKNNFEIRQKQLQHSWLSANEVDSISVTLDEERELEAEAVLMTPKQAKKHWGGLYR